MAERQSSAAESRITAARPLRDEAGISLIITLLVMLIVSAIGVAMATSASTDMTISVNTQHGAQAFYAADSGLEQIKVDLATDASWVTQMLDIRKMGLWDPFPDAFTVNGNAVSVSKVSGQVVPGYYTLGTAAGLGDGHYSRQVLLPATTAPANAKGSRTQVVLPVRSVGTAGSFETGTQVVRADSTVIVERATPWDNAIFAGDRTVIDPFDRVRNGVEVRGSVHVLGNPSSPSVTEIEDAFRLVNHYSGLGDANHLGADATKLPGLAPTTLPNGEIVESLDAEVRVQDGSVLIQSVTASLGQPNVDGNGVKETIDGFYVDGGISGGGGSELNSDNTGGYDLPSDAMNFPALSDPYVDPDTGTPYASGTAYLSANSMTVPVGEISIDVAAFHYQDMNGNLIDWEPSTNTLQIEGIVRFSAGSLLIGDSSGGPDATGRVKYSGTGTLWADRIELRHDLVPVGNYLDVDGGGTVNSIGLIADTQIGVAVGDGTRPVTVMAAMYAGVEFRVYRIARIAGTVMSPYFDKTRGFEIYQVPTLATNLPPGMPDSRTVRIISVTLADWYEES